MVTHVALIVVVTFFQLHPVVPQRCEWATHKLGHRQRIEGLAWWLLTTGSNRPYFDLVCGRHNHGE